MRIGIIGAGRMGSTLADHFSSAGHDVRVGRPVEDTARFGELVVVAIPFKDYRDVPPHAVAGKVVIDVMNYFPDRDGQIAELDTGETTSSELLQQHLNDAIVVKAFNAIRWTSLRDKAKPRATDGHIGIPISGDDDAAKQEVDDLIAEIGFDGIDAGSLAAGGRKHQPGTPVFVADLSSAELAEAVAD